VKRLSILGSTGSIGTNTLNIVKKFPEKFQIVGLATGEKVDVLKEQILQFKPKVASLKKEKDAERLKKELQGMDIRIVHGEEGLNEVASLEDVDLVVSALVGAVGLVPTLKAIEKGHDIALANKEALVMAGQLVMKKAEQKGIKILPIDSEHSGLFQSLMGHKKGFVRRIILTASGGPFLHLPAESFPHVTPEQALAHPNWKMGPKVTIDSATLMNKGLEVVEARWLFDISPDKIEILIHPQSIVHALVEYVDGSIIAQMAIPDMCIPISYALSFPERLEMDRAYQLNLSSLRNLTFIEPDRKKFPAINLAYMALEKGGTLPAVMNAANEIAVKGFLESKILFDQIPILIKKAMENHKVQPIRGVEDVLEADKWARIKTQEEIQRLHSSRYT